MQPAYISLLFLPLLLNSFYVFAGDICDGAQFAAAFDNAQRQALLDAHNNLRKNIADGKQDSKDGKLPSAKNMYQLKYSCRMETILQAELDKCTGSATLTSQYGQNILTSASLNGLAKAELIKAAIEIWTGPLKHYGLKNITNYDDDRLYTFANMAYAKTLRFGCAYKQCNQPQEAHISCIYNLVGGFRGNALYEQGNKCSKNKDCTTYTGSTCVTADGLCKFTGTPPLPGGGTSTMCKNDAMTDQARTAVLEAHNNRRSLLARGLVRNGKNPTNRNLSAATYMPAMVYECNLETEAMNYASTCPQTKSSESDRSGHGENIYVYSTPHADPVAAFKEATENWWNQINADGINWGVTFTQNLRDKTIDQKAFTQMAWAKSVQIGCAINTCDRSSVLVCRYNPAGNILNQQIYQPGRVCSGCLGACNTSDGLCKIL